MKLEVLEVSKIDGYFKSNFLHCTMSKNSISQTIQACLWYFCFLELLYFCYVSVWCKQGWRNLVKSALILLKVSWQYCFWSLLRKRYLRVDHSAAVQIIIITGTPPLTRFSYSAVFYLTWFFWALKPRYYSI